jgi:hypothetical protein
MSDVPFLRTAVEPGDWHNCRRRTVRGVIAARISHYLVKPARVESRRNGAGSPEGFGAVTFTPNRPCLATANGNGTLHVLRVRDAR